MGSLDRALRQAISAFVEQVSSLAWQASATSLEAAFAHRTKQAPAQRTAHPQGYGRRSTSEIAAVSNRFLEFVAENPGLRIEQINKRLGTTTRELARPIRRLVSGGAIKVKGRKRSTTYHVPTDVRSAH
jgi:CRP-like cAMP-binding protein